MDARKGSKQDVAAAAVRVAGRSDSQITEVIEADGGKSLPLADRVAAAAATFLLGGASYFVCWVLIGFFASDASNGDLLGFMLKLWKVPAVATLVTTACAFIAPKWTYRMFGKLMEPFGALF